MNLRDVNQGLMHMVPRLCAPPSTGRAGEDGDTGASALQNFATLVQGFARSPALDALATKFLGAAEDARSAVVEEVKTAAAALTGDAKASGDLYERYIQKAITKVEAAFCHQNPAACVAARLIHSRHVPWSVRRPTKSSPAPLPHVSSALS